MIDIAHQLLEITSELNDIKAYIKFLRKTRRDMFLEEWLDGQEVMQMLNISTRTLQTLRSNKTLPFSRINGKFYYKTKDVQNLLESNYTGTKTQSND